MISFLSCDWGTSSFRINLVDPAGFHILASQSSNHGILDTYNLWKTTGSNPQDRTSYYLQVIHEHIGLIETAINRSLDNVPVIISGMASSSIGLLPLPYQDLPFAINGSGALSKFFAASENFKHEVLLISGVKSNDDVMRGEETQLIGCIPPDLDPTVENIFIFPGTHSKHITISGGNVTAFRTFMTGEFFDLLSTKSILGAGMKKPDEKESMDLIKGFAQGVNRSIGANLLHASFMARTNDLFGTFTATENFNYLSGLLIGYELQELAGTDPNHIYLCCGTGLQRYYETAFEVLGLKNIHSFEIQFVKEAVIKGQYLVYDKYKQHA